MKRKHILKKLLMLVVALTMTGLLPAAADEPAEGWYYIKSKYNPYTQKLSDGDNPAGITVQNGNMAWDQLLRSDPAFIFKLEKADDPSASTDYAYNQNMFYLYNLKEDSWYNGIGCLEPSSGTIREDFYFKQDKENRKYMTFEKDSEGNYFMRSQIQSALPISGTDAAADNDKKIIIMGSSVSTYQTTVYIKHHPFIRTDPTENNTCVWTFEKVPDAELNVARMKVALRKACQMLNDYSLSTLGTDDLITNTTSERPNGLGSQLFSMNYTTSAYWQGAQPLSHLVDGKLNTWFMSAYTNESEYTNDPSNMYLNTPFIQVDLSSDDADNKQAAGVQLSMAPCTSNWGVVGLGWAFFPTDITVFGTNDASIAEQTSKYSLDEISTMDGWYKIGDYDLQPFLTETDDYYGQDTPKPTIINLQASDLYITKRIVFPDGQKYRFIRFYINNTTVNFSTQRFTKIAELQLKELTDITATPGLQDEITTLRELTAAGNKKIQNGEDVTKEELDTLQTAIKAVEESANPARTELKALLDSIEDAHVQFYVGTDPGMHIDSLVTLYNNAIAEAKTGVSAALSDAEYAQLIRNIRQTLKIAQSNAIPLSDGYYNIVNAYPFFYRTKAMIGLPTKNIVGWDDYEATNPAEVFKITKTGEDEYSIQNVVTGKYINTIAGQSQEPTVTDTPVTPQTITAITRFRGQFNIANTANPMAYHTRYHEGGVGPKGYICTYNGGGDSYSAWRLQTVTGNRLDSLLSVADAYRVKEQALAEIDTARTVYDQTFNYKTDYLPTGDMTQGGLITNCDDSDPDNCQVWAQQEPDAVGAGVSSYANLIDGSAKTWFQSTWQSSIATCPQFFQVDLKDHPISDFKFLFGLRAYSWGAWEQWTDVTIYASNDVTTATDDAITTIDQISNLSTWKKIGDYRLPEEQAIREWAWEERRIYTDVNHLGDKYRFLRFFVNKTFKAYPDADAAAGVYNVGTYSIGEFQIYENTYDEGNRPYDYEPGLKAVADSLRTQQLLVSDHFETSSVTQDELDELIRLRKAVEAKTPLKSVLQTVYQTDSTYVNRFAAGEDFGDVTETEMTAMQNALQNAQAVLDEARPSRAELDAQVSALNEAFAAFKSAQSQFEPNKWYYIVSTDQSRQGSTENNGAAYTGDVNETFTYGNCAYAANDNTSDTSDGLGTGNRNALKWGYYAAGTAAGGSEGVDLYSGNLDPHTMWRFVPVEGGFAIQNRANGRFVKSYTSSTPVSLTADTAAYVFENLGSGQYRFRSDAASIYVRFAGNGLVTPSGTANEPSGLGSFTLVPVETADEAVMEYPTENTISIKSLPYAVSNSILSLNQGVSEVYGIKGLEVVGTDSTLLLEKKTSLEAGEPFILECGDYTAYDSASVTPSNLILPAVDEFSFEAKTVNGLTAVLDYTTVQKPGLGYFADNVLKATTEGTGIEGHTGYLNVNDMPLFTTTTDADRRIPLNGAGVDAIKSITDGHDAIVNVYSMDGKLIKKNVNSSKAVKGLGKGLYIVGKKKVSVK